MKFLSAASTAALAGLLLLVPTAHGASYFKCSEDQNFAISALDRLIHYCDVNIAKSGDPVGPDGKACKTNRWRQFTPRGSSVEYILQLIDIAPFFRIYEKSYEDYRLNPAGTWELCPYHNDT
ncbi:BgTH12-07811 [Blumeria graminis f. sp. triticale]|uniref:BgTH12-07811 n=1 Tax=Blumeria graminis f. sp. triticale TaxID=1689686 RepID=A0A9W4GK57_BLUGR|nr:BgTH12-07811 [Blumeria graminis f. sp. triticale]